jgi:hypothetical protein
MKSAGLASRPVLAGKVSTACRSNSEKYYGLDVDRSFEIRVDGVRIAVEHWPGPARGEWMEADYPLPATSAVRSVIAFRATKGTAVIYGVRIVQSPEGGEP